MGNMNFNKLMQQAQKAQQKMSELQKEAAKLTAEAQAGGGMVTAVASGEGKIVSIKIDPEVIKEEDHEMLQDLVIAAVNAAITKAKEEVESRMQEEMKGLTGGMGLNLPGMG